MPQALQFLTVLIGTHKVAFADFQAIVPQNPIGSGDMEEKLRQAVVGQVGVAKQCFLFRSAWA